MKNEYLNMVLLGKPRIWFYITVVLFIATGVFLMLDWKQGRVIALTPMVFAVVGLMGWTGQSVPDNDSAGIQKCRRPWFGLMALLLVVPVVSMGVERHPDGSAKGEFSRMWDTMFGKRPPLEIRRERRSESLGLVNVDFFVITNRSQDRIVPISARLQDSSRAIPISLPQMLEPNETVEARVQSKNGRVLIEKGDVLTIKCKGYAKPLILSW